MLRSYETHQTGSVGVQGAADTGSRILLGGGGGGDAAAASLSQPAPL